MNLSQDKMFARLLTTFTKSFASPKIVFWAKFHQDNIPKGPIDNKPALVQIMAWHWPGAKPFSEPVVA